MFFDTHTHLNDESFDEDLEEVIKKAVENKISKMVVIGYDYESSKKAIDIANKYEFIYAVVGLHPGSKEQLNEKYLSKIEELLKEKKVVAIGEIGLDFYRDKSYKELQKEFFEKQIKLAYKYDKAIVIHSRDAGQDTYDVLKENKKYIKRGIMHCYAYSAELAKEFIKLGLYISLGGPVTFKNAVVSKKVAKEVDLKHMLIETDCPYLSPHPHRGKRNEPKLVKLVAEEIANLKNKPLELVARETYKNAKRVFKIED